MTTILLPLLLAAAQAPLLPETVHDLHFDTPAKTWDEAVPLGNGILGALLWGDGDPARISLDRTDLWDLRPVPEYSLPDYTYATMRQWEKEGRVDDLLRMYDNPYNKPAPTKIPAGRIELKFPQRAPFADTGLTLLDATGAMRFGDDVAMRVWIHGTEPVGMIEVDNAMPRLDLIAPAFAGKEEGSGKPAISAGDLRQLGYPAPVATEGETWRAFTQEGWGGFRFAVYVAWRAVEGNWRGAWSVASSREGDDPAALARDRVERALEDTATLRASHEAWWRAYWEKSGLRVPSVAIEKQWYLDTYKFGAASRRDAPPITLQGPWTADDGTLPPWKGDYHHDLNTELSYWPCYSGNHLEEGLAYLDWLWATRENCVAWTKKFFGMPGMAVPMTADLNNNQIGGWRQYTHSATTGAWLAQHFYLHWKYSGDKTFLAERAYPYLRDCAVFFEAITSERDANGLRTLPLSSSPEINDNRPDAWFPTITNYDLALIRWDFEKTAELAEALGNADDAAHWRGLLQELPEFSTGEDGKMLVAKDYPLPASHRHFSHLLAIHPLGLLTWEQGGAARQTIRASMADLDKLGTDWWCGYSFAWLGSMAARAKDGEKAAWALETFPNFTLRNGFHCNGDQSGKGLSKFTYRPFTLEGNFAAAAGTQEMLLQSYSGEIVVFPAIPPTWRDVSFTTLRAEGGVLVSATMEHGELTYLSLRADTEQERVVRCVPAGQVFKGKFPAGEEVNLTTDGFSFSYLLSGFWGTPNSGDASNSSSAENIKTILHSKKTAVKLGEPILIDIDCKSMEEKPISFDTGRLCLNENFTVFDSENKSVPSLQVLMSSCISMKSIHNNETIYLETNYDIGAEYLFQKPGKYYIQMNNPPSNKLEITLEQGEISSAHSIAEKILPILPPKWYISAGIFFEKVDDSNDISKSPLGDKIFMCFYGGRSTTQRSMVFVWRTNTQIAIENTEEAKYFDIKGPVECLGKVSNGYLYAYAKILPFGTPNWDDPIASLKSVLLPKE